MATPVQPPRKHRRYFSIPTDVDGLKALLKPLFEAGYFEGVPTDAEPLSAKADAYGRPLLIVIVESATWKDSKGMGEMTALRRAEVVAREPNCHACGDLGWVWEMSERVTCRECQGKREGN